MSRRVYTVYQIALDDPVIENMKGIFRDSQSSATFPDICFMFYRSRIVRSAYEKILFWTV